MMKNIYSKLVLVSLLIATFSGTANARECVDCKKTNAKNAAVLSKAAVCKRAQSTAELNINNVRALINGYGNMWYDGSVAQYHLPKNSNTCPLFCAALWIGGTDVNDQLRLAALRFGSEGDDYWPGPLKVNGTASVDLPVCNAYDRHWVITKNEVQGLMSQFEWDNETGLVIGPKADADIDAYMTTAISTWPAHGEGDDVSHYLAPFHDSNLDGEYNPYDGDYPYYDFDNKLCPRTIKSENPGQNYINVRTMEEEADTTLISGSVLPDQVLKGDQTIWWVFNDKGNTHTESKGEAIGLEIRAQAFAFATNDEINNMTFYSYEIINRSTYELRETYFSQWIDADLGYAFDDYVGCDVRRGLGYCYNGDENDGPGSGSYSGIPPAIGIDFFQGPYMDPDGIDNPKIDITYILGSGNAPLIALLNNYKTDNGYDTIALTDDADLFLNLDHNSWYFHPGDAVGNCAINGVNFGNNIIDDERFGMRRFIYYNNNSTAQNGEPRKASDYYNYLRGYWKNNQRMKFGGNGFTSYTDDVDCDFMFPGDSDPWNWGTDGTPVSNSNWTEVSEGNAPDDRRFMQSAGPFTLKPGALNYITVGIPFAQASSGNAYSSVELLREIDDVCQALFENCFKVLDGPQAPTMTAQELENEVILYLHYDNPSSNNYNEKYIEPDPSIVRTYLDESGNTRYYSEEARSYKFEGYQIYQLVDANASIADIGDVTKARLVAQCDIENYYDSVVVNGTDTVRNDSPALPIGTLVNFSTNSATGLLTGTVMVNGANKGIQHVFRITNDAFATGTNTALVNNREYYFVAIAYAHNRYKAYSQTDPSYLDGQKEPYLAGRQNEFRGAITPITVIPHSPFAEDGGKIAQAEFGMSPTITRIEGHGNGGQILRLSQRSIEELMGAPNEQAKAPGSFQSRVTYLPSSGLFRESSFMKDPCIIEHPEYQENYGPLNIRVIDPLQLKAGRFNIHIYNNVDNPRRVLNNINDSLENVSANSRWYITNEDNPGDTSWSDFIISRSNEQLFLDLGIAVSLVNPVDPATRYNFQENWATGKDNMFGGNVLNFNLSGGVTTSGAVLGSQITYADPSMQWLSGIPDNDSYATWNWIRSGNQYAMESYKNFSSGSGAYSTSDPYLEEDYFRGFTTGNARSAGTVADSSYSVDREQQYEGIIGGTWSPYALVSTLPFHPGFNFSYLMPSDDVLASLGVNKNAKERNLVMPIYNKSILYSNLANQPSVHIVFTADTTKWTRCPVLEMCDDYTQAEGEARKFTMRRHASGDKMGRTRQDLEDSSIAYTVGTASDPAYIADSGMGWFPGYAINTTTGERLNIMFGEDSRYIQYNGRDMMWNPVYTDVEGEDNYVMGGRHFIYVMNATNQLFPDISAPYTGTAHNNEYTRRYYRTPSYDAGEWCVKMLRSVNNLFRTRYTQNDVYYGVIGSEYGTSGIPERDSIAMLYASVAWVNMPLVNSRFAFTNPMDIPCDVTVDIDIRAPYRRYMGDNFTKAEAPYANRNMPLYQFTIKESDAVLTGLATRDNAEQNYIDSILNRINVVPNPYYSYSDYETGSQLESKVRIVNLPTGIETKDGSKTLAGCVINIYTVDGTLVRQLGPTPVNATTIDWDLHNHTGIPIAGGMYLIHVKVPGVGERVIKWFGTMRPVDLNSFQF